MELAISKILLSLSENTKVSERYLRFVSLILTRQDVDAFVSERNSMQLCGNALCDAHVCSSAEAAAKLRAEGRYAIDRRNARIYDNQSTLHFRFCGEQCLLACALLKQALNAEATAAQRALKAPKQLLYMVFPEMDRIVIDKLRERVLRAAKEFGDSPNRTVSLEVKERPVAPVSLEVKERPVSLEVKEQSVSLVSPEVKEQSVAVEVKEQLAVLDDSGSSREPHTGNKHSSSAVVEKNVNNSNEKDNIIISNERKKKKKKNDSEYSVEGYVPRLVRFAQPPSECQVHKSSGATVRTPVSILKKKEQPEQRLVAETSVLPSCEHSKGGTNERALKREGVLKSRVVERSPDASGITIHPQIVEQMNKKSAVPDNNEETYVEEEWIEDGAQYDEEEIEDDQTDDEYDNPLDFADSDDDREEISRELKKAVEESMKKPFPFILNTLMRWITPNTTLFFHPELEMKESEQQQSELVQSAPSITNKMSMENMDEKDMKALEVFDKIYKQENIDIGDDLKQMKKEIQEYALKKRQEEYTANVCQKKVERIVIEHDAVTLERLRVIEKTLLDLYVYEVLQNLFFSLTFCCLSAPQMCALRCA